MIARVTGAVSRAKKWAGSVACGALAFSSSSPRTAIFRCGDGHTHARVAQFDGARDVHRMNALKTVLGTTINGIALVYLSSAAGAMGVGAVDGGPARSSAGMRARDSPSALTNVGCERLSLWLVCIVSVWLFVKSWV